jgi:tetratricopeptide (TPR) repeat protein
MAYVYDVFISYRHTQMDMSISKQLHSRLETFKLPRILKVMGYEDIRRVFRDEEEMPLSGILSDTIEHALKNSKCLVVVCSKETPVSEWVKRELNTFIELGRAGNIFAVVTSGNPDTSFPEPLHRIPDIAERTIYLKSVQQKQKMYEIQGSCLQIIARTTDCPYDRLLKETSRNDAVKKAKIIISSLAVLLLLGFYCAYQLDIVNENRLQADKEREIVVNTLSNITYGVTEDSDKFSGVYEKMEQTLSVIAEQLTDIINDGGADLASITLKTDNYINLASAWQTLGNTEKALNYADEAVKTATKFADAPYFRDQKTMREYISSQEDPELAFKNGKKMGEDIVINYFNLNGKKILAGAYMAKATVLTASGDFQQAIDNLFDAKAIYDLLISVGKSCNRQFIQQEELATLYGQIGLCLLNIQSLKSSREYTNKAIKIYEKLYNQKNSEYLDELGSYYINIGDSYVLAGNNKDALTNYAIGMGYLYGLYVIKRDKISADLIASHVPSYAAALFINNQFQEAVSEIESAYTLWEKYIDLNNSLNVQLYFRLLQSYSNNLVELDADQGLKILRQLKNSLADRLKSDATNIALRYQLAEVDYRMGYTYILKDEINNANIYLDEALKNFEITYKMSAYSKDYGVKEAIFLEETGLLMAYAGDYDTARAYVKKAVDLCHNLHEDGKYRGVKAKYFFALTIHEILSTKDCPKAIKYIHQALELDPSNLELRLWRAYLDMTTGAVNTSLDQIKEIITACPYMAQVIKRDIRVFNYLGLNLPYTRISAIINVKH